ncbi:MAG: metabolite traffic protein EboE [Phycisphaerae bacterium]
MRVQSNPPVHLTYCLNVHRGETWAENFDAIREYALDVRDRVGHSGPFGLGLRLSRQAADELIHPREIAEFRKFLDLEDLYVFTINGFAYGRFHGTAVKRDVYAPDWRNDERMQYTVTLARILSQLLPAGVNGSISTVPLSYKGWISGEADIRRMVRMLADAALELHLLATPEQHIALALEPEPDCFIENTAELVAFFARHTGQAVEYMHKERGMPEEMAAWIWRRHVGVCLDTAHAAVEFEDPARSLEQIQDAGVTVAKVQLSAALRVRSTPEAMVRLGQFADDTYLHQVKARKRHDGLASFADLPDALAAGPEGFEEMRVHYHVPLFFEAHEALESSAGMLKGKFADALSSGACGHVEIETYTFSVLPDFLRPADIRDGIAREFDWVMTNVFGSAATG